MKTLEAYKNCYHKIRKYIQVNKSIQNLLEKDCYYPYAYEVLKKLTVCDNTEEYLFKKVQEYEKSNQRNALKGWIVP